DLVLGRNIAELAHVGFRALDDLVERLRPVTDLHDGHADAWQRDEIALGLLEHLQRQDRRPGGEIEDPMDGHALTPQLTAFGALPVSLKHLTMRTVSAATASCA